MDFAVVRTGASRIPVKIESPDWTGATANNKYLKEILHFTIVLKSVER